MRGVSNKLISSALLTRISEIFGKYNTTPYDKLKLDLHYIQNYSLMLDVKLMIQTVKILFMKESTEGVAVGQTTATRGLFELEHSEKASKI